MRRLVVAGCILALAAGARPAFAATDGAPAAGLVEANGRVAGLVVISMAVLASGLAALTLVTLLRRRKG